MSDDLKARVELHHRKIFGDPENLKTDPGIIAEQDRMSFKQDRTNEILMDLKKDVTRIIYMFGGAILTAIVTLFVKLIHP